MKPRYLLPLFTALLLTSAYSQEEAHNRFEIFAGYSHTSYGIFQNYSGPWVSHPFNGFEASGTVNLLSHVGAEVNFSNVFSPTNHYSLQTVVAGPHISAQSNRFGIYVHALFGALSFGGGSSSNATSFAFVLGGGADLWLNRHIGARLVQFDYIHNNNQAAVLGFQPGGTTGPGSAYRLATGIVFRFGR